MTIPAAAKPRPIRSVDAKVALTDPDTGRPSVHGLVQQEELRNYVLGAGRITPCSASGTNLITLTPNDASPSLEKYVFGDVFIFWAPNTTTGAVTATVVPKTGTLSTLKVYVGGGSTQAGLGDITAGLLYVACYMPTLDSNAGGFALLGGVGGGWASVFKVADESITSDATLSDDAELSYAIAANTTYAIRGSILYSTAATPDFKYDITGPAAPTLVSISTQYVAPGSAVFTGGLFMASLGAGGSPVAGGAGSGRVMIDGVIQNGANAGTVHFQWCQNTSNGSATTVQAGSYLEFKAVA